jgi:hypothetical protein
VTTWDGRLLGDRLTLTAIHPGPGEEHAMALTCRDTVVKTLAPRASPTQISRDQRIAGSRFGGRARPSVRAARDRQRSGAHALVRAKPPSRVGVRVDQLVRSSGRVPPARSVIAGVWHAARVLRRHAAHAEDALAPLAQHQETVAL